jgi:TonB family protein
MYIDFEERPELDRLASPISRREGILLSLIGHLGFLVLILVAPNLSFVRAAIERSEAARAEVLRQMELERERERPPRFVFVAPRVDTEAPRAPDIAEYSDKDRIAQAPERSRTPANPLPFARGNTSERVEAAPEIVARGRGETPEPAMGTETGRGVSEETNGTGSTRLPELGRTNPLIAEGPAGPPRGDEGPSPVPGGSLGEALRNLERFARQQETFGNELGGGGQYGPSIQFDTKGVEFGPWIRRFVAQIKRNWFIPYAAMAFKGHVVITFNVHKNGAITDLAVVKPSTVDAFNSSAYNALAASNPTMPLPPEYPADRAFFTVTFFYNEAPPP